MCAHAYTHTRAHTTCMHRHKHTCTTRICTNVRTDVHIHMCAHTFAHITHVCTHVYKHAHRALAPLLSYLSSPVPHSPPPPASLSSTRGSSPASSSSSVLPFVRVLPPSPQLSSLSHCSNFSPWLRACTPTQNYFLFSPSSLARSFSGQFLFPFPEKSYPLGSRALRKDES